LETTSSTQVRSTAVPSMPSRGPFTFPSPYNTTGVRLTNETDCGGADCVDYIGYSFWRNTNYHVGSNTMLIFVTLDRNRGGAGPALFSYDKTTDQVTKVRPLFDPSSPFSWATGERWYWSPPCRPSSTSPMPSAPSSTATTSTPRSSRWSSTSPASSEATRTSGRRTPATTTRCTRPRSGAPARSEEHTSEL